MATEKTKTPLQAALLGDVDQEEIAELRSDIKALFKSSSGYELADAVVERVQRFAAEKYGVDEEDDAEEIAEFDLDEIIEIIQNQLSWYVSSFISDTHREFFVRAHAQGISTSDAVTELMWSDKTMNRLAHKDAMGTQGLRDALIPRVAYLKPGSARWPEKKYGAVWREALEAHRQEMSNVRLTSKAEQIALLVEHVERTNRKLQRESLDAKEYQLLTKSLTETMATIRELSAVDEPMPVDLSAPQLVGVIERLTLALGAPDQNAIGGDAQQIVGLLQKLALALKAPEQKTDGNGVNALPAPADGDNAG